MKSKRFRIQKDAVKAVNVSMALFIKLLTKSCELIHTNTVSELSTAKIRNTLDIADLVKVVHRYDVLEFLKDLVDEMDVPVATEVSDKRKMDSSDGGPARDEDTSPRSGNEIYDEPQRQSKKPKVIQQGSILSFFSKASRKVSDDEVQVVNSD